MPTRSGQQYLKPYLCQNCMKFYSSEIFNNKCSRCYSSISTGEPATSVEFEEKCNELGAETLVIAADVSNEEKCKDTVQSTLKKWDKKEILNRTKMLEKRFKEIWPFPDVKLDEKDKNEEINVFDDPIPGIKSSSGSRTTSPLAPLNKVSVIPMLINS